MIMRTLKVIAAAMLILSPIAIQAATCEQFKAGNRRGCRPVSSAGTKISVGLR